MFGRLRLLLSDESWTGGWVRGDGRFIVNLFIRFETIERGFLLSRGIFILPLFVRRSELLNNQKIIFYITWHPLFVSVSRLFPNRIYSEYSCVKLLLRYILIYLLIVLLIFDSRSKVFQNFDTACLNYEISPLTLYPLKVTNRSI